MSFLLPNPRLEPLLRYLSMPAKLVHRAPQSNLLALQTVPLRDTALAAGSAFHFDDSCQVTVVEGGLDRLADHLKLTLVGAPRTVKGLHLVMLSHTCQLQLSVGGDKVRAVVGSGVSGRISAVLASQATLFIGDGSSLPNARLLAAHADVAIGDDCQIGEETLIQASDPHPIIDLDTGQPLNAQRRQVTLGSHVWVGRRVLILPDVSLGDGCIVDAGSTVVEDVAAQTQVGGAPAVLRRQRVGWARQYGGKPPQF